MYEIVAPPVKLTIKTIVFTVKTFHIALCARHVISDLITLWQLTLLVAIPLQLTGSHRNICVINMLPLPNGSIAHLICVL